MNQTVTYLQELTAIPSPTGFTREIADYLVKTIEGFGYEVTRTAKGGVNVTVPGVITDKQRYVTAHVDTLGAIVRAVKADGRLKLDRIGGLSGMDKNGWTWYGNTNEIDGLSNGACPKEVLWRGEKSSNNDWETNNFPPSLYGKGLINPTQNFVDAFPDKNGYPITDPNSVYKDTIPYANRDPRLSAYVVLNGGKVGVNNTAINTNADAKDSKDNTKLNKDGINHFSGSSTRTGYYLRKLLRQDVNLEPTATSKQMHYTPRIRFTEIFLNYAEAANEAWGPTGNGGHGYSAYDIIAALHNRAGVGNDYLESIKTDKDKMRQLIRNERRIELSFEGFRFWDLRRWNAPLTEKAMGMSINSANKTTYTPVDVETRDYKEYMNYGPIPYSEVLKFNQLQQNKGWEFK